MGTFQKIHCRGIYTLDTVNFQLNSYISSVSILTIFQKNIAHGSIGKPCLKRYLTLRTDHYINQIQSYKKMCQKCELDNFKKEKRLLK